MSTFINDFANNLVLANSGGTIRPQVATADVTGQAVDLVDAEGNCAAILTVGALSGTTTVAVKIQEDPASGGSYSDISGATFTSVTAANKAQVITFKRTRRYCRAYATLTGSTTSAAIQVVIVGTKKNI